MGLYVEFDVSDYGYVSEVQGDIADMFPVYAVMDFAPACEAFVKTFIEEAQRLVPVDTGYLRSTINATTDGFHCSAEATAEYAEYVLSLKERTGVRATTLDRYRELLERINAAIGHIKLADLRPQHLNSFYKNLSEPGIRAGGGSATAKIDLAKWLKESKKSRASIAEAAGISAATMGVAVKGEPIREDKAEAIARAMGKKVAEVFRVEQNTAPLSDKTILEHHRLISTILAQAEKEMLVPYNAAAKATPPKVEKHDPNYFQPETISEILKALEAEPLKWQLITHLLLVTGCRRGELCALQWSDFTGTQNGLLLTVSRSRSSVPGKGIVEGSTKNGKSREVYLSSGLRGILLAYKRRKQMEADKQRRKLSPYLFTDEHGQLIHPDTFTKRLRKIYDAIGFPREYHLHTLRHYFVTSLLHCGVDKQTVADLVGHADTGFLERTYCHPQQAQKEQAADSMLTMLRPDGEQIFNLAAACSPKQHSA